MHENRLFHVGARNCLVELAITLLTVCKVLAITVQKALPSSVGEGLIWQIFLISAKVI